MLLANFVMWVVRSFWKASWHRVWARPLLAKPAGTMTEVSGTKCGGTPVYVDSSTLRSRYPASEEIAGISDWCVSTENDVRSILGKTKEWNPAASYSYSDFYIDGNGLVKESIREEGQIADLALRRCKLSPPPPALQNHALSLRLNYPDVRIAVDLSLSKLVPLEELLKRLFNDSDLLGNRVRICNIFFILHNNRHRRPLQAIP